MKQAINNDGVEVEVEDSVTVTTINGVHYLLTTAEKAEQAARTAAWDAGAVKRGAQAEINRLEGEVTERRKREAILGTDNGWLSAQEALISTERAKL